MTSTFYKAGTLLFARCKNDSFCVSKIIAVDLNRKRCYLRFEDNTTHWCGNEYMQSIEKFDHLKCSLCRRDYLSNPDNEILCCSSCGLSYHRNCHNPAIVESFEFILFKCRVCFYLESGLKNDVFNQKSIKPRQRKVIISPFKPISYNDLKENLDINLNPIRENYSPESLPPKADVEMKTEALNDPTYYQLKKLKSESVKLKYFKASRSNISPTSKKRFRQTSAQSQVIRPKSSAASLFTTSSTALSAADEPVLDKSKSLARSDDVINKLKMPKTAVDVSHIEELNQSRKKYEKKDLDEKDLNILKRAVFYHLEPSGESREKDQGTILGRRVALDGSTEYLIHWTHQPHNTLV